MSDALVIIVNKPTVTDDYGNVVQHHGHDDFCWGPAVGEHYGVWSGGAWGDSLDYQHPTDRAWDWEDVFAGLAPGRDVTVYDYMTGETFTADVLRAAMRDENEARRFYYPLDEAGRPVQPHQRGYAAALRREMFA